MRIPAWRAFLLGGLVAMAVYFALPDTERTAAGSAVFHYASAVAVLTGIRRYRPADPWPWGLLATALLALGRSTPRSCSRWPTSSLWPCWRGC